jgi:adenine nucleotide transporter 17
MLVLVLYLQTPYKGMLDGLYRCGKEEGISGLWKGVTTNLILVSNPTVHYFIYDRLKIWAAALVEVRGKPLGSGEIFLMGAIAKCVATVLTYPIQVAQAQLRNDRR